MMKNPHVSFIILGYNSEAYIRDAISGAFSQTYSPLEIVLSDDRSTDRTFEIMEEEAGAYQGPHAIRLNQNERNLGIGGHVNRLMEISSGDIVVVAAGDDISCPNRVEILLKAYEDEKVMSAFSDHVEIDQMGTQGKIVSVAPDELFSELHVMCRRMFRGVTGATNSWRRELFDFFGPMAKSVVFEDRVLAFRAAMLGRIVHIDHPLVQYRRHGANTVGMFHQASREDHRKRLQCFLDVYQSNLEDLRIWCKSARQGGSALQSCARVIRREIEKLEGYLELMEPDFRTKIAGLVRVLRNGGNPSRLVWALIKNGR